MEANDYWIFSYYLYRISFCSCVCMYVHGMRWHHKVHELGYNYAFLKTLWYSLNCVLEWVTSYSSSSETHVKFLERHSAGLTRTCWTSLIFPRIITAPIHWKRSWRDLVKGIVISKLSLHQKLHLVPQEHRNFEISRMQFVLLTLWSSSRQHNRYKWWQKHLTEWDCFKIKVRFSDALLVSHRTIQRQRMQNTFTFMLNSSTYNLHIWCSRRSFYERRQGEQEVKRIHCRHSVSRLCVSASQAVPFRFWPQVVKVLDSRFWVHFCTFVHSYAVHGCINGCINGFRGWTDQPHPKTLNKI